MRYIKGTFWLSVYLVLAFSFKFYLFSQKEPALELRNDLVHKIESDRCLSLLTSATVTVYHPEESQTDDTPYISASGRFVYEGQVALSRDLFKKGIKYGDKVEIEGLGEFVVEDKMNPRFKDSIDIFSFDRNKGFKVEKVVKIYYKCR